MRYDGRPLFFRLALSEMNIPYADPRRPFHKKAVFDLGDAGAGYTANNLKLGCDCLGAIHYISATLSSPTGGTMEMPNCVCIHEQVRMDNFPWPPFNLPRGCDRYCVSADCPTARQDMGIGWKHTNYRTERAVVTRNRELVIQSILTVSNYEYILAFKFNQAGEVAYEVRATGILSTQPIDPDVKVPWGTVVHPGVLAVHHQHLFSLRVDPMIDGIKNSVIYEEAHPMPYSKDLNPYRTGYTTREFPIEQSGGFDFDMTKNRVFKIRNNSSINPVTKSPVGYKVVMPDFQKMLADPESFHHKRAEFADHNIYVTKYREGQLYAAGQYTNQSRGGLGVRGWAHGRDPVVDEDIVVWLQFGMNHVPRVEDFPVMPCEVMTVRLKPVNFFDQNPALDVPPSTQAVNKSCLLSGPSAVESAAFANGRSQTHSTTNGHA